MPRLIYVIGASGSGKDSVMQYARSRSTVEDSFTFAHRYITRPADAGGENHVALSQEEFARRSARGLFCMQWDSHGNRYGIGVEIERWLESGLDVVVNGSRAYLPDAERRFGAALTPTLIRVSPEALRARLIGRGRESLDEIENRIQRAVEHDVAHPRLVEIRNDGALEESGEALLSLLRGVAVA